MILDYLVLGLQLTVGFIIGIGFHILIMIFVPYGEEIIKSLWIIAFMFPVVVVPLSLLIFVPFAPFTVLALVGGFLLMGAYAILYVVGAVFD
jgi:hypothetical protein